MSLIYKEEGYKINGACFEKIIVEIKAVKGITDEHRAQVQNYLRATGYKLGLIVNFGHYQKIEIKRVAN